MRNRKLIFLLILLQLIIVHTYSNVAENEQGELSINQTGGPSARGAHMMAYDSFNKKTILFGGLERADEIQESDDTWVFDNENRTWTELRPLTKPSARSDAEMVYDSTNQRMIVFGGDTTDTWSFNYQTGEWTEILANTQLLPKRFHSMVYDSTDSKIYLFGGCAGDQMFSDDFWVFDCTTDTWIELDPPTKPSARYSQSMTYDSTNHHLILFGGGSANGFKSDTWVYNCTSNIWTEVSPSHHPESRKKASMVYDPINNKSLLFAGQSADRFKSDTWSYSYITNQWEELFPPESPSERSTHKMVYNQENENFMLFGGFNYSIVSLNDTWIYDYTDNSWEELSTTSGTLTPTDTVGECSIEVIIYSLIFVGVPLFYLRRRNKKHFI